MFNKYNLTKDQMLRLECARISGIPANARELYNFIKDKERDEVMNTIRTVVLNR